MAKTNVDSLRLSLAIEGLIPIHTAVVRVRLAVEV
jgi:hypothetical protein